MLLTLCVFKAILIFMVICLSLTPDILYVFYSTVGSLSFYPVSDVASLGGGSHLYCGSRNVFETNLVNSIILT